MKTKDLFYIGAIGFLGYLFLRKKRASDISNALPSSSNGTPVGNSTNGGLNLGSNMDLPNLTPTPVNGLSTEVALSSSNINPLIISSNEPAQIFGAIQLPPPYMSTSIVNPYPVDIVPALETLNTATPTISTAISEIMTAEPLVPVGSTLTPIATGESTVIEPYFSIKTITADLMTDEPNMGSAIPIIEDVTDEMILKCGNSFSVSNNDKEGSYVNFWFDGTNYYTQTMGSLIKSFPAKISKKIFFDACRKIQ